MLSVSCVAVTHPKPVTSSVVNFQMSSTSPWYAPACRRPMAVLGCSVRFGIVTSTSVGKTLTFVHAVFLYPYVTMLQQNILIFGYTCYVQPVICLFNVKID